MALTRINTDMFKDNAISLAKIDPATGLTTQYYERHFNYPGNIIVNNGTIRWWSQGELLISRIRAQVDTDPLGANITIVVRKNGTSVQTVTITAGQSSSQINTNITTANGDYITVDITNTGLSPVGSNLVVSFLFTRTAL
jgi:hypothetical protein